MVYYIIVAINANVKNKDAWLLIIYTREHVNSWNENMGKNSIWGLTCESWTYMKILSCNGKFIKLSVERPDTRNSLLQVLQTIWSLPQLLNSAISSHRQHVTKCDCRIWTWHLNWTHYLWIDLTSNGTELFSIIY